MSIMEIYSKDFDRIFKNLYLYYKSKFSSGVEYTSLISFFKHVIDQDTNTVERYLRPPFRTDDCIIVHFINRYSQLYHYIIDNEFCLIKRFLLFYENARKSNKLYVDLSELQSIIECIDIDVFNLKKNIEYRIKNMRFNYE